MLGADCHGLSGTYVHVQTFSILKEPGIDKGALKILAFIVCDQSHFPYISFGPQVQLTEVIDQAVLDQGQSD